MRTADQVQLVPVQELGDHIHAEREAHTAIVLAPALNILVRIAPQEVAQQPGVRHICGPHQATDLLHALKIGTEATVAAENLLVNDRGYRQTVEAICEGLPQFDIVPALALIIEACKSDYNIE